MGPISSNASTASGTAFTEIWNGRRGELAKVPWPKAPRRRFTLGVSCYAAHSCEAVGADSTDPVTATDPSTDAVAVSFNGTAGTLQAVPAPPRATRMCSAT